MTETLRPSTASRAGFALPAALAVLVLLSVLVVTVYANAMASFQSGTTDRGKIQSHFAAEAGAENAMAQLALALQDAVLTQAEMNAITPPTIANFTYDSFDVDTIGAPTLETITDGPFAGLKSLTQIVDIYAEASDPDGNSSAVVVTAKAQAIPIFQFGVFYEKDLEVDNLPPMVFGGWVHTNGSFWTGPSGTAYYEDLITTPNKYYRDAKAWHVSVPNSRVRIADATSTLQDVTFDSRTYPAAADFIFNSNADFDDRLKTDAYNVDSLRVPLPNGVPPIEVIMPRDVLDTPLERTAKFSWKADWVITIDLANIAAGSEATDLCDSGSGAITYIRDGGEGVPTESECNNIFSFEFDKWYEGRELRYADVLDVDIQELQDWATGADSTAIVYINMLTTGADDPEGDGLYPIVRLYDAATLDYPLTMSSVHPMYTWGNYNSTGWQPAALVADAVTILSTAWDDSDPQHHTPINGWSVNRTDWARGGTTFVYAAVLAGHSSSPCDHHAGVNNGNCTMGSNSANYGGGLENFPRFLEDYRYSGYSTRAVTYVGSLVSLFYAQQATGQWKFSTSDYAQYYWPPTRLWSFDTRFEYPENLPPGTPVVGNVIHTAFRPVY